MNHGEAVLYGILSAVKLSKNLKILNLNDYKLIISHLSKLNYNNLNKFFNNKDLDKIINFMKVDKKNTSKKINFITLKKIGTVYINTQLNTSWIKKFLKSELLD